MKSKVICKMVIDIIMLVLLFIEMACRFTGIEFHEWAGISIFVLFVIHNILNLDWYKSLLKGSYNAIRIFHTIINTLLIISIFGALFSGIMQSSFFNISNSMFIMRLHIISAYWSFIFISMHLGLHWNVFMVAVQNRKKSNISDFNQTFILRVMVILICVYGMYAFYIREVAFKLIGYYLYDFWNSNQSVALFFIYYISIMGLFACLAYYLRKLIFYCSITKNKLREESR